MTGTLPTVCYAAGMTKFLYAIGVRIFDYPQFASTLRDRVRERAAALAAQAGITIEHIAKSHIRKEAVVAEVLKRRGEHPGLVHVISAMEACGAYQPWHDKQTHKTFVRPDSGKCLHYYFYFIDAELGLVYLRVPTWAPFRLQFYCNGHSWLARQLTAKGIGFTAADNAFIRIDDWQRAQDLATGCRPTGCTWCLTAAPVLGPAKAGPVGRAVLPGARHIPPVLPLEPDAGRVRNRPGLPLSRDAQAALPTSRPRVGAERQGGADRQLSRPSDQPATGPGDRFSVFHSHRGDLHQTPLCQFLDQDVRQVRLRAPH